MNPIRTLEANAASQASSQNRYLAIVVDNNDPKKLQAVRVTIPGLLEATDLTMLPWFQRAAPSTASGVGDNYGSLSVPRIGARVYVHLQGGDANFGTYGEDAITSHFVLHEELAKNYPNRLGFVNAQGDLFYLDLQEKALKYVHHSGTTLMIDDAGSVTLVGAKDWTQVVKGNYVLQIDGTASTEVKGANSVTTGGAYTENRKGGSRTNTSGDVVDAASGKRTMTQSSTSHTGKLKVAGEVTANGVPLSSHTHPKTGGPLA